jgi:NADH-quinone oxidoreductase subunit G
LSAFKNASMEASCDVLLPVSPFTETSGTFVNTEGRWQSFNGVTAPLGEARPAWKVLRVLGNLFDVDGFDYISSDEVLEEVKLKTTTVVQDNSLEWRCPETLSVKPEDMMRIAEVPMYAVDALVRRASSLQQTKDANGVAIRVNSNLAQRLGLYEGSQAKARQGNFEVTLPIVIDERVADNSVLIQAAAQSSAGLKCDFEPLSLHQA